MTRVVEKGAVEKEAVEEEAVEKEAVVKRAGRSPSRQLRAQAGRFQFDAALRILMRQAGTADPAEAASFRTPPGLAFPPADIAEVAPAAERGLPTVTTPVIGLTGAGGVLPRYYSEMVTTTLRNRSRALHQFLDMLGQRFVASFARAGMKYRLSRAAETAALSAPETMPKAAEALLAFTGYATPHLVDRFAAGTDSLLHYSGLFSSRPRSADKLAALVSDWLGLSVEVIQFAGAWLPLPPSQQSGLAHGRHDGQWNRLGVDAAIGVRAWDPQARIVLRIGPLDRATFDSLLPDGPQLQRLVALVRAFVGFEVGFAVNPVLAAAEIPPLRLDGNTAQLGWNSWAPSPAPALPGMARRDGDEAVFEAEIVEAKTRRAAAA